MKTLLTIVSKNQQQYAARMKEAVEAMSCIPDRVLIVLDRPTAQELKDTQDIFGSPLYHVVSVQDIPSYAGRPQMKYGIPYFCAGAARNMAARFAMEADYDAVIFIDGDCYPEPDLVNAHLELLESEEPAVTVGRRNEAKHGWHDQREKDAEHPIPIFGKQERITKEAFFVDSGVVWTCNMGINRQAMSEIMSLNKALFGRDELCSSDFSGTWGGEDGYLGLEAFYLDIPVMPVCRKGAGVRHVEHDRPLDKYDHETFVAYLEEKREELLYLMKANGRPCPRYVPKGIIIGNRDWVKK